MLLNVNLAVPIVTISSRSSDYYVGMITFVTSSTYTPPQDLSVCNCSFTYILSQIPLPLNWPVWLRCLAVAIFSTLIIVPTTSPSSLVDRVKLRHLVCATKPPVPFTPSSHLSFSQKSLSSYSSLFPTSLKLQMQLLCPPYVHFWLKIFSLFQTSSFLNTKGQKPEFWQVYTTWRCLRRNGLRKGNINAYKGKKQD